MNFLNSSLRVKLISLSLGICILLGSTSTGILKHIINEQQDGHLDDFSVYSDTLNDSISAQFYERYGDVQAFAMNPDIKSNKRQTIIDALNQYAALYGIYDLIMVVDAKGNLVAVNNKAPDGKDIQVQGLYKKNYANTEWFTSVMNDKTTDAKDKGFTGTYFESVQIDPYTTEVFSENRLGNSFSAAIKDSTGKTIGVVTNRAGSRWFEVAFKEVYKSLKKTDNPSSILSLYQKDGTLLFQYPLKKGSEDVVYDWNRFTKENVSKIENSAIKEMLSGKTGSKFLVDPKTKMDMMVGYDLVSGPKFIESIGWSVMVEDSKQEVIVDLLTAQKIFYFIYSIVMLISVFLAYWFSSILSKKISAISEQLADGSTQVADASQKISNSSNSLSESTTEQASAIQETASSIEEVSAMVKKSSENAQESIVVSGQSRKSAENGQQAVLEMIDSIKKISQSNQSIVTRVEEGNQQISEIVKVISEIENKTKVINDIVFQTKLLSFNASVEAARAGEHGKGFAVVAEEVGNLAAMSGNAAKEISAMLESSIKKVEDIVNETKSRVQGLVVESKSSVEEGTEIAEKCGKALSEIFGTVQEVDRMVNEISLASNEQSQGVSEINKAMNQLNQVTQQNSSISQETAGFAQSLSTQSKTLKNMVDELFGVVNGTHHSTHSYTAVEPKSNKIIQFKPKEKKQTSKVQVIDQPLSKTAGSSDAAVPQNDDPRFQDV